MKQVLRHMHRWNLLHLHIILTHIHSCLLVLFPSRQRFHHLFRKKLGTRMLSKQSLQIRRFFWPIMSSWKIYKTLSLVHVHHDHVGHAFLIKNRAAKTRETNELTNHHVSCMFLDHIKTSACPAPGSFPWPIFLDKCRCIIGMLFFSVIFWGLSRFLWTCPSLFLLPCRSFLFGLETTKHGTSAFLKKRFKTVDKRQAWLPWLANQTPCCPMQNGMVKKLHPYKPQIACSLRFREHLRHIKTANSSSHSLSLLFVPKHLPP